MLAFLFASLLAAMAGGQDSPEQIVRQVASEPAPDAAARRAAEERIRAMLARPDTARFEWRERWVPAGYRVSRARDLVYGYVGCGRVNASDRNGFPAGWHYFLIVARGGEILAARIDGGRDMTIRSHCAAYGLLDRATP